MTRSTQMTKERANEILALGAHFANYSDFCTPAEDAEVRALWDTMPGNTCWYDALCYIAYIAKEAAQ